MSCTMGLQYLLVRDQLTGSVLLLGIQSSLALQNYTACTLANAVREAGGAESLGSSTPPLPYPPGPQSPVLLRSQWELLLNLHGETGCSPCRSASSDESQKAPEKPCDAPPPGLYGLGRGERKWRWEAFVSPQQKNSFL